MHIDMVGTKSSERLAAAKRTSEGTAAQARRANLAGWQPVRRSKSAWHADEPHLQTPRAAPGTAKARAGPSTAASAAPAAPAPRPAGVATAAVYSGPSPAPVPPNGPSPEQTKAEQARLLTLLRTLHPVLVVDQLCKALAYFGGVPDAPPPSDGLFPNSAATNGSGLLLVAWLSEIFPPVENPGVIGPPLHLPPLSSVAGRSGWGIPESSAGTSPYAAGRRARGRPKGSKSSKARKDKGTKKPGPSPSIDGALEPSETNQPILVDEPDPDNVANDAGHQPSSSQATAPPGAEPGSSLDPGSSSKSIPGARKRGRPKGSKNRPKSHPGIPRGTSDLTSAGPAAPSQTATSALRHAPTAVQHTPTTSERAHNGSATTQGPPNTFSGNDAALPVAADSTRPHTEAGPTPTLIEGQLRRQQVPSAQDDDAAKPSGGKAPPRRKSVKRPGQNDNEATANGATAAADAPSHVSASSPQGPTPKRRRISKESSKQSGAGLESQTLPTYTAPSPALNHQSLGSASPPLSASRSFDSQKSIGNRPSNTTTGSSRGERQNQQPPQPQVQQPQRVHGPQLHPQSSNLSGTEQHQQYHPLQPAGPAGSRSQAAGAFGAPPRGEQQPANISPQMLYAQQQQQQQLAGQIGQGGRLGATFGRGVSGSHPQYAQHMARQSSGGRGAAATPQQRNLATPGAQLRRQQVPGGVRQAQGYNNQQRAQGAAQGPMNSFAGYGEQSYLNMDYGLTERDVQEAAAVTALGNSAQLHGHHMYQGMGPR